MENKHIIWIVIALILLIWASQQPQTVFILFGGEEIKGFVSDVRGECWTLGQERCVRQNVNLVNFTKQNLLACPEGYYSSEQLCREKYFPKPKPKINCYYISERECKVEILEADVCPSQYYSSMEECTEKLKKSPIYHLKTLFKSPATIIILIIGIIAIIILFVKRRK